MCVLVNAQGVSVKLPAFDGKALSDRIAFAFGLATTRHRLATQGELAELLAKNSGVGIKASALSRWLSGSRPSFEHLVTLAELAVVDPGWLAVGDLSAAPAPTTYLRPAPLIEEEPAPRGRKPKKKEKESA